MSRRNRINTKCLYAPGSARVLRSRCVGKLESCVRIKGVREKRQSRLAARKYAGNGLSEALNEMLRTNAPPSLRSCRHKKETKEGKKKGNGARDVKKALTSVGHGRPARYLHDSNLQKAFGPNYLSACMYAGYIVEQFSKHVIVFLKAPAQSMFRFLLSSMSTVGVEHVTL